MNQIINNNHINRIINNNQINELNKNIKKINQSNNK